LGRGARKPEKKNPKNNGPLMGGLEKNFSLGLKPIRFKAKFFSPVSFKAHPGESFRGFPVGPNLGIPIFYHLQKKEGEPPGPIGGKEGNPGGQFHQAKFDQPVPAERPS